MKPEEQRIAIQEALGWRRIYHAEKGDGHKNWLDERSKGRLEIEVPDYLTDLNAAMQAARHFKDHVLDASGWVRFGNHIEDAHPTAELSLNDGDGVDRYDFATLLVETSAATICECLLKTANLWKP
jgi:hypothetical protein